MRAAVLFDIDGTLLRTSGASTGALAQALAGVLGIAPEVAHTAMLDIDFRGATDRNLWRQLAEALKFEVDAYHAKLLATYLEHLELNLTRHLVQVMPGVHDLLSALLAREDVSVGILTGNFRHAARLKLGAIGHAPLADRAGGFGEDGVLRHELAAVARRRLHESGLHGNAPVIVVGDTEHDVSCGKHIGAFTVAVATGWTEWETLQAAQPDVLLRDLSTPEPLLELLR
jgi:phosphoglycolate phosphatase